MSDLFGDQPHKRCSRCKSLKPVGDFYLRRTAKGTPCRAQPCKTCHSGLMADAYADPEVAARAKDNYLRWKYGISRVEYDVLFAAQGGVCAICRNAETRVNPRTGTVRLLAVDHDHLTGAIRKLLCSACNRGLGFFKDDLRLLRAAVSYLEAHAPR